MGTGKNILNGGFIFVVLLILLQYCVPKRYGGLALYTLRDEMAQDPLSTLNQVADDGYAYVEAAGYTDGKFYGMAPAEFKNSLNDLGLRPLSSHQGSVNLENADAMIADVKAAGFEYF